ncbi:MAG: VWA domain-containing protein, partial [Chloroflexota bacterium]|nr:VWA domain-containing protein [Chloroflexota bacterium]
GNGCAMSLHLGQPSLLLLLVLVPFFALLTLRLARRSGRLRRSVVLLRIGVFAALVVAVAEPLSVRTSTSATTIFVVDRSSSVATADGDASVTSWVTNALSSGGDSNNAAIVSFGGSADVSIASSPAATIGGDWVDAVDLSSIDPDFTNIETALALARSMPVGGNRRIVLVSDGAENVGAAANQVSQAADDGIPIDVVQVAGAGNDDLRIDSVTAPVAIWQGERPNVLVGVSTATAGVATLDLVIDDVLIERQEVTLVPGLTSYAFTLPDLSAGFHSIRIDVAGDATIDQFGENNSAPAALIVRAEPKVLLISAAGSDPARMVDALSASGAEVTNVTPDQLTAQLSVLRSYDAFVLDNVPATDLETEQIIAIQEATRSYGKGLVVLGGTSSYGPGQYAGTRLEDMLPVTVRVADGRERQRVALLLIVDRSGSMAYDPLHETSKIEMAKEAMHLAGTAMSTGDTIGVLTFSDSQEWVFPLTTIGGEGTRQALNSAIDTIKPTGGTEMYPALQVGLDAIRNIDADVRHVVVLSDGKSKSGTADAFDQLVVDAGADRTTISTIAIGNDADTALMQSIAESGGGRYHFTTKAEEIPRLTLEEAQSAGSQSVIRGAFNPVQTLPSPIMNGFEPTSMPPLDGYDFASARPGAQVILVSHRNDPVLAKWQYGLGRVVSWTPDSGSDLASQWQTWERFDEFWSGVLRWTLPDPSNRAIQVSVGHDGPDLVLTLTTGNDRADHDYVDLSGVSARITGPGGAVTEGIQPVQSGFGTYQIRIGSGARGAYQLELLSGTGEAVGDLLAFSLPGSPELLPAPEAGDLLTTIAERTGGRLLSVEDWDEAFATATSGDVVLRTYRPLWLPFAILALVLFLIELALRTNGFTRLRSLLGRSRPVSTRD